MEGWPVSGNQSVLQRTSVLCNSEAFSDVRLFVGPEGTQFYGHKFILAVGSPFFEKLFFGSMPSRDGLVTLPTIEPSVFQRLLRYMYTDEFIPADDEDDEWELLELSKMCLIPSLTGKCAMSLVQQLRSDNVLHILSRAIAIDEGCVVEASLRYFDWDAGSIIWTEEFMAVDWDMLCLLLQRNTLCVKECDLHDAVLRWTEAECHRQGLEPSKENQRQVLGQALYLIRFPIMNSKQFSFRSSPECGLLLPEEVKCISQRENPGLFSTIKRSFAPERFNVRRFTSYGFTDDVPLDQLTDDGGTFLMNFRFVSDRLIFLHGLCAYGAFQDPSASAAVTTELRVDVYSKNVKNNDETLLATSAAYTVSQYPCPPDLVKVRCDENGPIIIYPGVEYRVSAMGTISVYRIKQTRASSSVPIRSCYGIGCIPKIVIGNSNGSATAAVLTILGPTLPDYPPTVRDKYIVGQIPELIFSV